MINIPNTPGAWKVSHSGELFGVLKRAENVHFDQTGYLTPSKKAVSLYSSATDALFGLPLNILYFNTGYLVLTDGDVWTITTDLTLTNITDGESNAVDPNQGSDMVVWQNRAYVTGDVSTDVRYWSGSAWTSLTGTINISSDSYPHPMAVFENFNQLAIAQRNVVSKYNTSHSLVAADQLTIPIDYTITGMVWRHNNLYIATKSENGQEAKMFIWNGSGTSAQNAYGVGSDWIFAITEYRDSIVLVTNNGEILRFNGGGFTQLAAFPLFYSEYRWDNNSGNLVGKVHPRGLKSDGDLLYINVNGSVAGRQDVANTTTTNGLYLSNQPSGLWCYDPEVGLYCRHYHTTDGYQTLTASALSNNTLTLSAAIQAQTGDPILVQENGSLTGVSDDIVYYLIRVSSTEIKLANTRYEAINGTAITLGGAVTSASLKVVEYSQNGELFMRSESPGGIGIIQADSGDPPIIPRLFETPIVWGFTDRSAATYLNALTVGVGTGFLHVVRILSNGIKTTWQKVITKTLGFYSDTDKVIVSTNTRSRQDMPTGIITGSYSNTLTIGAASSLLDRATEGDVVVIVSGSGSGQRRVVKSVSGDEITLTEAVESASGGDSVIFYIEPLKVSQTADTNTPTVTDEYVETSLGSGNTSVLVDVAVELRGEMRVPQMHLVHNINKPAA